MKLAIGSTIIDITSCTRMRDTKRGFYLDIQLPKENIGMEELYSLLDDCEETIVVTDDNGNVSKYVGFKTLGSFACEDGVYRIAQICTSEYEAQLSLAQNEIIKLQNIIDEQSEVIEAQAEEIESQAEVLDYLLMV